MKELLQQYSAYNYWANERLIQRILELPEHQQVAESASSFNSLHKTVMHIWRTETVWWQRIDTKGNVAIPGENMNCGTPACRARIAVSIKDVDRKGLTCQRR
jgi:uncharacterized damage-inducible protein DinB